MITDFPPDVGKSGSNLLENIADRASGHNAAGSRWIVGAKIRCQQLVEHVEAALVPAFLIAALDDGEEFFSRR